MVEQWRKDYEAMSSRAGDGEGGSWPAKIGAVRTPSDLEGIGFEMERRKRNISVTGPTRNFHKTSTFQAALGERGAWVSQPPFPRGVSVLN